MFVVRVVMLSVVCSVFLLWLMEMYLVLLFGVGLDLRASNLFGGAVVEECALVSF